MLKCIVFNARSLKSLQKRIDLAELLSSDSYGIVAVTETWLDASFTDAMLVTHPCNNGRYPYSVIRKDRNVNGGGVCILVHNDLVTTSVQIAPQFRELELIAIDLSFGGVMQRFICVYYPQRDVNSAHSLAECLSGLCSVQFPVSACGDFNLPGINWQTFECPNDNVHNTLLDCFLGNSLNQFVENPTRERNVLDLVLC